MKLSFDFFQDSKVFPSHFVSLSLFCKCPKLVLGLPSQFGPFWEPEKPRKSQGMGWKCVRGRRMEGEEREGSEVFLREMCLLGNFVKSGLCSFSFKDEKKLSSFPL